MSTAVVDIGTLIVKTPGVLGGRPRIDGTRIAVAHVATLWRHSYAAEEIAGSIYEYVDLAGVYAALGYYFANRGAVDASIAAEAELHRKIATQR